MELSNFEKNITEMISYYTPQIKKDFSWDLQEAYLPLMVIDIMSNNDYCLNLQNLTKQLNHRMKMNGTLPKSFQYSTMSVGNILNSIDGMGLKLTPENYFQGFEGKEVYTHPYSEKLFKKLVSKGSIKNDLLLQDLFIQKKTQQILQERRLNHE